MSDETLQAVFLLTDKPIISLDPEDLREHPLNREIFGDLPEEEYLALKKDIEERGIQDPLHVVKKDGSWLIVSGHQRAKIARELKIKVPCIVRDDLKEDWQIREHLIKDNLLRRHLTAARRAEVILKLAEVEAEKARERQRIQAIINNPRIPEEKKRDQESLFFEEKGKAIEKAIERAREYGLVVGYHTVRKAKKILEVAKEDPEIKEKWEKAKEGELSVEDVYRKVRVREKREKVRQKIKPPGEIHGKFDVIYADPPWRYEFTPSETRSIENQYPTMSLEEICNLKIPTADDAVLFLWCPMPKLEEGLKVINSWGFKYRTGFVWVKDKIGMGHYARLRHELLLIAVKGSPKTPSPEARPDSVIEYPRTEHSKKPEIVYEIIERMYPNRRYLELFARKRREGWEVWGNEV